MSRLKEDLPKYGSEITVRISVTFQEAPAIHTLLAMTPVRERGKLLRVALDRYIAATSHPAGNVEMQIIAISNWLRARQPGPAEDKVNSCSLDAASSPVAAAPVQIRLESSRPETSTNRVERLPSATATSSVSRWLRN